MAKKGKVVIDRELCKGCLLCIRACPAQVLESEQSSADGRLNAQGS